MMQAFISLIIFALQMRTAYAFPMPAKFTKPAAFKFMKLHHSGPLISTLKMTTGLDEDPQLNENNVKETNTNFGETLKDMLTPPENEFEARMGVSNVLLCIALASVLCKWSLNLNGYSYDWVRVEGTPIPQVRIFSLKDARVDRQLLLEDRRYQYEKAIMKKQQEQNLQQSQFPMKEITLKSE